MATARIDREFVSSDCWLLLAIQGAARERPATLAEVIEVGDGINKSIFSAAELDGGLNRLLAARFIETAEGLFSLAAEGHRMLELVSAPRRGVLDVWERLHRLLLCPCCGPNLKSVRRRIRVTPADAAQAYREYSRRFEGYLRSIDPANNGKR